MKMMPTIRELMKEVGHKEHSVSYGCSTSVLTVLNKPVLAYGIGYAGFVCVFKTYHGKSLGVNYSVSRLLGYKWGPKASFTQLTTEKALEEIRNNKLFARTDIDEKEIAKIEPWTKQERKKLGTIEFLRRYANQKISSSEELIKIDLSLFKNGKICPTRVYSHGYSVRVNFKYFSDLYSAAKNETEYFIMWGSKYLVKFGQIDVSKETKDKIEAQIALENL